MPVCLTCRTQKPVYEFQEGSAGESEICIPCAHEAAEQLKARSALPSASEARQLAATRRVLRLPAKRSAGRSAARGHSASPPAPPKRNQKQQPLAPASRNPKPGAPLVTPDLDVLRAEIEREVRARLEAELRPPKVSARAVGFRIVAFDSEDRPLRYGQLLAALAEVSALCKKHRLPSLETDWWAWSNGAWLKASPSLAIHVVQRLEASAIEGLEVFDGYPEEFFLNAVPV